MGGRNAKSHKQYVTKNLNLAIKLPRSQTTDYCEQDYRKCESNTLGLWK